MATLSKIVRPALSVKGREVTVTSPLILPEGVNGLVFRVKRPTREDDRGQFFEKDVNTFFQVWQSKDGSEWTKSWGFGDVGGVSVVNDHPWTPRVWQRGEVCNDLTTRYRALEDTDQPPTNEKYWQPLGAWVPKEADYSFIDFGVKEDGLIYMVTATHDGDKPQKIEPELVYTTGERFKPVPHNSVGYVDSDIGASTGTVITSPGLTVSGSDTLFAAMVGCYACSTTAMKLNNGSGADFTEVNEAANAYNSVENYRINNPTNGDAIYLVTSTGPYRFLRILSVNNADQSTQPLSGGTWTTQGAWAGGSKTFSNNIPAASGAMVVGAAMFTDLDYTALSNPTVGSGQNAFGAAEYASTHAIVGSYEVAGSSSESTSFTLVETAGVSQTIYYAIAVWTIKEVSGGPQTYDVTLRDNISVSETLRRTAERVRTIPEAISVTDSLSSVVAGAPIVRTLTDNIDVTDSLLRTAEEFRTLSDSISATDTISADVENAVVLRILSDSCAVTDSISKGQNLTRVLSENISVTDTVDRFGIGPSGSCSFDCAVGTVSLAMRNMGWTGATNTSGFKFQFSYNINGGSFSDWADIDNPNVSDVDWYVNGAGWPFEFDDDGEDFTSGDVVGVTMRAVDDSGDGDATAIQYYKLHDTWHRTGVSRHKPSSTVGHASGMWDVVATNPIQGNLTTGGTDRAVLAMTGMAYGTDDPDTPIHAFSYDGVSADKFIAYYELDEQREENGGAGGSEGFILTGVDTGTNTARFDWVNPTTERSLAMSAVALKNVHQSSPIAAHRTKMLPITGTIPYPGVSDLGRDATYDDLVGSSIYNFHCPQIPASYDEGIISFLESYGTPTGTGAQDPDLFGENPESGSTWTAGSTTSTGRHTDHIPMTPSANMTLFAGAGLGQEDCCRMAAFDDGEVPSTMPIHMQRWYAALVHDWGTVTGIIIRPTPNMISSNSVLSAGLSSISVRDAMLVNHGSVLHAVYTQGDTAPTAVQIQDEIDSPGSSDYSGTFHLASERVIVSGDSLAVTGGNLDTTLAGLALGNYALASVYQSQQAFKGGTADLGEVLTQNFDITQVVYDVTLSDSVAVNDAEHSWLALSRYTMDTMDLVDAAMQSIIRERYLGESASLTDTLAREFLYTKVLQDDAEVIDSLFSQLSGLIVRLLAENIDVADLTARSVEYNRGLVETRIDLTEVTNAARELYRGMQDAVATTGDAMQVEAWLVHALEDSISNVADALVKEQILERILRDEIVIEDSVGTVIGVLLGAVIRGIVFKLNDLQRPDFFRLTDEE